MKPILKTTKFQLKSLNLHMSQPKHVLILSSWFPSKDKPFLGNFVRQHAQLLAQKYQVTVLNVCSANVPSVEMNETTAENYREIQIYFPKTSNKLIRFIKEKKAFKFGLSKITQVDLIHAHVLLPKGYLFVRAKNKFQCPLLVTEHSSRFRQDKQPFFNRIERSILKRTTKQVDRFVAVSELLRNDLLQSIKITQCQVIGNPVNTNLFVPSTKNRDEHKRFLHISTLADIKNVKGIIDAFQRAFEENDFVKLTIISDENHDALKVYASKYPCSKNIDFVGPLRHEETIPFYQNTDFFILNSDYETFSIVVAEAWSCGIPVISTNVGIAANLSKDLGRNIPKNNPEHLSKTMLEIQASDFDAQQIRAHAMQFSDEQILAQIAALYDKI